MLRDYLNEFELDWAQAAVRSGQIPAGAWKNARILLIGEQPALQQAIAWSFLAWNDEKNCRLRVQEAECREGSLRVTRCFGRDDAPVFEPEEADYVILTGFCCREAELSVYEEIGVLQRFEELLQAVLETSCRRLLLLSDGRVYGSLPYAFAASEYEAGKTDPAAQGYEAQYLLQALEGLAVSYARRGRFACEILRTGLIYGACFPMLRHTVAELAKKTASEEEISLKLRPDRVSYISIHDVLTAIQFVLSRCPDNKIFNVSGRDSDVSDAEAAMLLYHNFPQQCRLQLKTEEETDPAQAVGGALLNTQLLYHYGFRPLVSLEDGLIILVKQLQNTGEIFVFDNTYLGKLSTVHEILLGYLLEIDRICKKHGIKYFLAGGTLLGAVRHHGFIPWDDDADVMMLRGDYERFLQVVQQELPEHVFVQLPHTEKGNYNPFTKLRINDTMFATEFTGHFMNMHNGIFFDVLSHDRTGNHRWSQKLHLMLTMLTRSVVFNKWGNTDVKGGGTHPLICWIVSRIKGLIPMKFALWAQNRSLEFFKNRKTDYLYDGMGRNLRRGAFPAAWLEEAVYVDFEGHQLPVPKEYDRYLTWLYGDYMQMIPVSQRRTSHSIVLTDLGAYSDYHVPSPESCREA